MSQIAGLAQTNGPASAGGFASDVRADTLQTTCPFYPVGPALTDLGGNEYFRLVSINPLTYAPTGIIGGLYPGGSNVRPPGHAADGIALASQIVPLDASGNPSSSGRIGMASLGMSNTQTDFGRFKTVADADPQVNDRLRLANGASSGGVVEVWADPNNPLYEEYWSRFEQQIANGGLTLAQVQVMWVKVTQYDYMPSFPADMRALTESYAQIARLLKTKLPNLKITYFSSRTRSFNYFMGLAPETTAFENGFAVRWLIEKQLNGDPSLNYDPANGPVMASYITWGPYLWIDGLNPRSDGEIWPVSSVVSDCTHPSREGADHVAQMMLRFFKSDPTAVGWFLNPGVPTVTPVFTLTPVASSTPTPVAVSGYRSPSANLPVTINSGDNNGFEVNPANAYFSDNAYAIDNDSGSGTQTTCTSNQKDRHIYYNFNLDIPATTMIRGLEVRLEAKAGSTIGSPHFCVELSWNDGASWTAAKMSANLTTSDALYTLGGPSDTWGHNWTPGDLTGSSVRVRLTGITNIPQQDLSLDWIGLKVYNQPWKFMQWLQIVIFGAPPVNQR